ncbi:MAG: helix-turn-helix domain-containing protein [Gemmatimonadota bacterium]
MLPVSFVRELLAEVRIDSDGAIDLTAEAAAQALGRAASTVRAWCASGRLARAYRLAGREWRIPVESLRDFQRAEEERHAERKVKRSAARSGAVDLSSWRRIKR